MSSARIEPDGERHDRERSLRYQRVRGELPAAEWQAVVEVRNAGRIIDEVLRRFAREVDLEIARLDV